MSAREVQAIGTASVVKRGGSYQVTIPRKVRNVLGIKVPMEYPFDVIFFDISENGAVLMISQKKAISRDFIERALGAGIVLKFPPKVIADEK